MNHSEIIFKKANFMSNKKVVVVGGGAAGMMACIAAARNKADVTLVEKNERLGKKLYITGKGRCNLTNACETDKFFDNICRNSKFMYSSFNAFTNFDLMYMIEDLGCKLCIQRGNRVFPLSERSIDIINVLEKELKRLNVKILLDTAVNDFEIKTDVCKGLKSPKIESDCVIIATGGLSYPTTGSTGDGHRFAEKLGLRVEKCTPSLTPINSDNSFVKELQGLSLKNVNLSIFDKKNKELFSKQGEMLFTHFGISGPLVLTASAIVGDILGKENLRAKIDLKPALSVEQLDARVLRDFEEQKNKSFKNSLNGLLPKTVIPVIIGLSQIKEDTVVNQITAKQRRMLVDIIKGFELNLTSLRGFNEAVITRGGVCIKEINPKTMETKRIKNLYFAGEVIDIDAMTGGFNLQLAFSTGYAAGYAASKV